MTEREFEMETVDGCTWSIAWFQDASAFFVDVWGWADKRRLPLMIPPGATFAGSPAA